MSTAPAPGPFATLDEVTQLAASGEPVVVPTDTVYGIGCDPRSRRAVSRVFELKQRPHDKPLPILVADLEEAERIVTVDAAAARLADRFWPGPLTLVLARRRDQTIYVTPNAIEATLAVRVPDHELCRAVLASTGPLAVTSANRSGEPPAATAAAARAAFDGNVPVLDGGVVGGEPSTIVSLVERPRILREGALPAAAIEDATGLALDGPGDGA